MSACPPERTYRTGTKRHRLTQLRSLAVHARAGGGELFDLAVAQCSGYD